MGRKREMTPVEATPTRSSDDLQCFGGEGAHLPGIVEAFRPGHGVGVAAVDDQGLQHLGVLLHHDLDGRGAHLVLGVGQGALAGTSEYDDGQVQVLFLYAAMHAAGPESLGAVMPPSITRYAIAQTPNPGKSSPVVSSSPNMMLQFCIA